MIDKASLLLLLWAGVTASTVVDLHKRVMGGQDCDQNDRHYHVRLSTVALDGTVGFCGGSLITDRWILTAAHCWETTRTMYATVGVHPGPGQRVEIFKEPVIYVDNNNKRHDIMLVQLPYPTNISPVRKPVCTSIPNDFQVAGHGSSSMGFYNQRRPGQSATLQCANMDLFNCNNLPDYMKTILDNYKNQALICAQRKNTDSCYGDSGGGLTHNNMIYGVLVFGAPDVACAHPTGFMSVCHYMTWIENTITTA